MAFGAAPLEEIIDGVRVFRIPSRRRNETHARLIEMALFGTRTRRALRCQHAKARYDVIHAQSILPEGLVATFPSVITRTVLTAHGSDVPGYNPDRYGLVHRLSAPLWKRTLRRTVAITSPSAHLAGLIRAAKPDAEVRVIPNGIDADLFEPSARRSGILIVARLVPRKNVAMVLEALQGIAPQSVHIVGDGPERASLVSVASRLEGHNVRFHGWLDHGGTKWRRLYETSRFFVFMSSQENFPINLLEAQLAGLVIVASDIPSNREVLGDDAEYTQLDVRSLHDRLQAIVDLSDDEVAELAQRGRSRVLKHFTWPIISTVYLATFGAPVHRVNSRTNEST